MFLKKLLFFENNYVLEHHMKFTEQTISKYKIIQKEKVLTKNTVWKLFCSILGPLNNIIRKALKSVNKIGLKGERKYQTLLKKLKNILSFLLYIYSRGKTRIYRFYILKSNQFFLCTTSFFVK